jgi:hypothetical protein
MTLKPKEYDAMDEVAMHSPAEHETPAPADPAVSLDLAALSLLSPIRELLERIAARLDGDAPSLPRPGHSQFENDLDGLRDELKSTGQLIIDTIASRLEEMEQRLTEFREETGDLLNLGADAPPPQWAETAEPAQSKGLLAADEQQWERIILGEELCWNPALTAVRQLFLDDVVSGVDAARALAAQLMLVQTATVDQLPELLKNVGEAYYRWRPRTSSADEPMEQALADWLTRHAEAAGLHNSIELVRPGDRFERTRHNAAGRGVEIVSVHGWVVLRGQNKVYTKANVSVR